MSKQIKINLFSQKSIDDAIQSINDYMTELDKKCEMFVDELGKEGVRIAKSNIQLLNAVFTGDMLNSVRSYEVPTFGDGYSCVIICDSEHAAFVEFGTGYNGRDGKHDYKLPDGYTWEYVVGNQIVANAEKGIYGWWYKDKQGNVRFTKGMEARPFMTRTDVELIRIASQVAERVFRTV